MPNFPLSTMAQYGHDLSLNCQGLAQRIPDFLAVMSPIALIVTDGVNMSPSILFIIGVYAVSATAGVVSSQNNAQSNVEGSEQKVTLTETIVPTRTTNDAPPSGPKTPAFATSPGMDAPLIKAVNAKPLQIRTEENKQTLVHKHETDKAAQIFEDRPGKCSPQTVNNDDCGYSAPLGLKDESHNDWVK